MRNNKYEQRNGSAQGFRIFDGPFNSKRDVAQYMASEETNEDKRNHL